MGTTRRASLPFDSLLKPLKKLDIKRRWKRRSIGTVSSIIEQTDLVSLLPSELAIHIFSHLDYGDLMLSQLVCKTWYLLASDHTIWRAKYASLALVYPSLIPALPDAHCATEWQHQCRRALREINWAEGNAQSVRIFESPGCSNIFSVKLKRGLLVTAAEDNSVRVWDVATGRPRWSRIFGDDLLVRCVDVVPELNALVVAFYGCKCHIYDVTRGAFSDPIQILKGGNHHLFVPDSIAIDENHFVVAGRKPSAVFVWKWRKGTRVANRAFDSQMHAVYLQGSHVVTLSRDGSFYIFNIDSNWVQHISFELPPAELPCFALDGLSMVCASTWAGRLFHFRFEEIRSEQSCGILPSVQEDAGESSHLLLARLRTSMSLPSLALPSRPEPAPLASPLAAPVDNTLRRHSLIRKSPTVLTSHPQRRTPGLPSRPQPDLTRKPRLSNVNPLLPTDVVSLAVSSHCSRIVVLGADGELGVYSDAGTRRAEVHPGKKGDAQLWEVTRDMIAGVTEREEWAHWCLLAADEEMCVVGGRGGLVVLGFSPKP